MSDNDRSDGHLRAYGAEPAAQPPRLRERVHPRMRVLKSGIIAFNGRHTTMPCAVRDISATGARLRTEMAANIPDTFELIIELDGFEVDCAVIWRSGLEVGAGFTSTPKRVAPKRKQVVSAVGPTERPSLRRKPVR